MRSLKSPEGVRINGCSLLVDHLLTQTGFCHIKDLDDAICGRSAWSSESPLNLRQSDDLTPHQIIKTTRAGLYRMAQHHLMPSFIGRHYRFSINPWVRKGRVQTILCVETRCLRSPQIASATGSAVANIKRHLAALHEGQTSGEPPELYCIKCLNTRDLSRF